MTVEQARNADYAAIEARVLAHFAATDLPRPERRLSEGDRRAIERWFPGRRAEHEH